MRETSVGLGVIQFMFAALLVCLLVWLALAVGVAALVVWAGYHVVTTRRAAAMEPAITDAHAKAAEQREHLNREPTNPPALAAAAFALAACVPFLFGHISWYGVGLGALATAVSYYVLHNDVPKSNATRYAMIGTLLLGVVLAIFTLINLWANAPITLYGENWGDNQGAVTTIEEYRAELPCIGRSMSPASSDQDLYALDTSDFTATASCTVSDSDGARPVVFVQASSADELEAICASGIIEVGKLDNNDMWVERDGVVAVVASDEASTDLVQDTGTTWINLRDDKP